MCLVDDTFSSVCSRNLFPRTLHDYCVCVLNHLADGILLQKKSQLKPRAVPMSERTKQEFCVLRNIHAPTFNVVVHLGSSDEKASVYVQMHSVCTVQTTVIVDNVAP